MLNITTINNLILRLTAACSAVLYLGLCHCLHGQFKLKAPDKAACVSPWLFDCWNNLVTEVALGYHVIFRESLAY